MGLLLVIKFSLLSFILGMFVMGVYDVLKNFEENGCEMTYMYELPQYMVGYSHPSV